LQQEYRGYGKDQNAAGGLDACFHKMNLTIIPMSSNFADLSDTNFSSASLFFFHEK